MATQDLRRQLNRHQKKATCVFKTDLDFTVDIATAGDTYQLFELPVDAYVVRAELIILVASDAGTTALGDVGFAGAPRAPSWILKWVCINWSEEILKARYRLRLLRIPVKRWRPCGMIM